MPSLDVLFSSSLLLTLAGLVTVVVAIILVWSTLGARRGAPGRLEIAARVADVAGPLAARDAVAPVEADGLEAYRWALAVREDAVGPDHPDVATACHILGAMYMERERFAEAEPLLQRALEIRIRSFGPSHSDVTSTRDDLADLYRAQGRRIEAESLRDSGPAAESPAVPPPPRKIEEPKPVAPPAREAVPESLDRPTGVAPQRQSLAPASAMRAVTPPSPAAKKAERHDGEELTRVLREIAGLQGTDAEPASAQELYRQALAMMEATGATDRPELRTALRELGRLYYRQGAYAEAEPLLERALALARRAGDAADVSQISEDLSWLRFSRRSLTER
jgi:tetratricopeptide (TPR) repeat protein